MCTCVCISKEKTYMYVARRRRWQRNPKKRITSMNPLSKNVMEIVVCINFHFWMRCSHTWHLVSTCFTLTFARPCRRMNLFSYHWTGIFLIGSLVPFVLKWQPRGVSVQLLFADHGFVENSYYIYLYMLCLAIISSYLTF